MRSDYALYTVAIIFFILTSMAAFALQAQSEKDLWVITTAVLGLLFIGLGYSQRPKTTGIETPPPQAPTALAMATEEKTETVMETAPTVAALTEVKGIGEKRAEQLKAIGINSTEDLAKASAKNLAVKLKISPKITVKWIENAEKLSGKP